MSYLPISIPISTYTHTHTEGKSILFPLSTGVWCDNINSLCQKTREKFINNRASRGLLPCMSMLFVFNQMAHAIC